MCLPFGSPPDSIAWCRCRDGLHGIASEMPARRFTRILRTGLLRSEPLTCSKPCAVGTEQHFHIGSHFQPAALTSVRPPTLIKLLVVWIYIRPPTTAGVLCVTSPNGFLVNRWNWSEASTTTTLPLVETQNKRPSTHTGEPK